MYIIVIIDIMQIITILRSSGSSYVSNEDTRAHSKDLDPVSVVAEAAKRSNTQAYQTVLGETTKFSMVDTRRPNHDEVQTVTAVNWLRRKRVAEYLQHFFVLGVS
jgi:hypothetical protein